MKKIYALGLLASVGLMNAQVGINTDDPKATLDVNGNVVIRTVKPAAAGATYDFLVHNNTTNEVQKFNGNFSSTGVNSTIAKAVDKDNITLLDGTLFAGWQKIKFSPGDLEINGGGHFSAANDYYTVPVDGIYRINYEFRYGNGLQISALNFNGEPAIGVLKHSGATYTVLDSRKFSRAGLPVVGSVILSSTTIDNVYQLTAGEKLSFEVRTGGLNLGMLTSSYASAVIYKISD